MRSSSLGGGPYFAYFCIFFNYFIIYTFKRAIKSLKGRRMVDRVNGNLLLFKLNAICIVFVLEK